jgi:predicted outer membrane repeat protein
MAGAADLDGYPRVIGPPDIGAYELSLYHYASTNGGNVWPYLTVNDGATNIQKAIDVSAPGDTVYVNDGIYRPAAELVIPTGRDITLRPWNLGGSVVLDGQNAHRVLLATNCAARIEGLTVRHGYVSGAGGGFLLSQGATVSACQFASNSAFSGGAICGPSGITISNCSFNVNTAYVGGAVHSFSSNPSEVTVLADCRLTGNGAANSGGGAYLTSGRVERCVFETNNAAGPGAGGIYLETGLVRNSLLVGNRANQSGACGGGVYGWCRIENCTIAGNQVPNGSGGGALASFVYNSIVYGNEAPSEPNLKVAFFQFGDHNNTEPAIGTFCITNAPRFVDAASGDYRLATNSLCLNAGANLDWMTASATDLEGYPRIVDGAADIGAYERTPVHYIHTRTKGRWPYLTPSDGFRDIQAVVESAHHGDTVYVAAGSYTQGTQIAVSKRITMTGSGGWAGTVIAGTASNRCFLVTTNAILDNLTLTRGYADVGGGAYLTGGAALRDCMVSSNRSGTYGGGAFIQTAGTLTRCSVVGNTAIAEGGGGVYLAQGGIVDSCQVFSNRARKAGGIFFGTGGRALNSLICQNQAVGPSEAHGGGLLFWQNGGRAEHCTVVSNSAAVGGGVYCNQGGALFNTLIYFNAADSGTNYHNQTGGGTFSACCTTPYIGTLCVTGNPCLTAGYRIDATSPCIDTATEILSRDIDGTPRPLDGDDSGLAVSDIGAYEHLNIYADSDWDGMPDGWENQHFGSPFGCTTPQADPDHDGQSNYRESIADTDPADSNSVFRALRIFWESEFWTVEASPSSALRVYSLQSSTNLTVSNSWTVVGSPHKRGNGGVIRFKNDSDSPVRFERVEVELP